MRSLSPASILQGTSGVGPQPPACCSLLTIFVLVLMTRTAVAQSDACTNRPAGYVCRLSQDSVCDPAEACNGMDTACPPDHFADDTQACVLNDPCTTKDHCHDGQCVAGIQICGAIAGQLCVASRDVFPCSRTGPQSRIDVRATVDRANLKGRAKFTAVAFR